MLMSILVAWDLTFSPSLNEPRVKEAVCIFLELPLWAADAMTKCRECCAGTGDQLSSAPERLSLNLRDPRTSQEITAQKLLFFYFLLFNFFLKNCYFFFKESKMPMRSDSLYCQQTSKLVCVCDAIILVGYQHICVTFGKPLAFLQVS